MSCTLWLAAELKFTDFCLLCHVSIPMAASELPLAALSWLSQSIRTQCLHCLKTSALHFRASSSSNGPMKRGRWLGHVMQCAARSACSLPETRRFQLPCQRPRPTVLSRAASAWCADDNPPPELGTAPLVAMLLPACMRLVDCPPQYTPESGSPAAAMTHPQLPDGRRFVPGITMP